MKLAILQMADEPQIVSTALMLRHAGYESRICGPGLRRELLEAGLDTVLSTSRMEDLGYDRLEGIREAEVRDVEKCDLFVEIKVRNVEKLWNRWPSLKGKTAYWRVNGSQPEICPKGGDEVNLPCPIITACLWYGSPRYTLKTDGQGNLTETKEAANHRQGNATSLENLREEWRSLKKGDNGMAYTFWPPYPRSKEYDEINRDKEPGWSPPYCLAHSARAWGFGEIIDQCAALGVRVYGNNSPAGQVSHRHVPNLVRESLCLVHLKSVDCPGWALYEAMLGGCPVVVPRLLNSRMLAYDLLEDGETCLEFGVPASEEYGRGPMEFEKCLSDIQTALVRLSSPEENRRIGENGRKRLNELMWRADRDGSGFLEFMRRNFG